MDDDMGLGAEAFLEAALHLGGFVVSLGKGEAAVQADVDLGGYTVSDAPGAEGVRVFHAVNAFDDFKHLVLRICGERTVRELPETGPQKVPGHFYQHCAYYN